MKHCDVQMRRRRCIGLACLLWALSGVAVAGQDVRQLSALTANLIPNWDFEKGGQNAFAYWSTHSPEGKHRYFGLSRCQGLDFSVAEFVPARIIVTPHIKWSKPYYKGPVRVLFLTKYESQREIVELAQRMDIDYTSSAFWRYNDWASFTDEDVRGKLKRQLDVIVIGSLSWKRFPEDIRQKLLSKVRDGTSLVYVEPRDLLNDLAEPVRQGRVANPATEWVTTGIPAEALPAFRDFRPFEKVAQFAELGAGRILFLNYRTIWLIEGWYDAGMLSLTPDVPYNAAAFHFWEYYHSFLAKCLLWAARKEPHISFRVVGVPQEPLYRDALPSHAIRVTFSTNSRATEKAVLELTVRDDHSRQEWATRQVITLPPGKSEKALSLQRLPNGLHLLDFILRLQPKGQGGGKRPVVDWGTWPLWVQAPVFVSEVTPTKQLLEPGEAVEATVTITSTGQPVGGGQWS